MEVGIKIVAENLTTGEKHHTNFCYVTMVAVNKNLKPIEIKPLTINNEIEQQHFKEAKMRRQMRLSLARAHSIRKNKK